MSQLWNILIIAALVSALTLGGCKKKEGGGPTNEPNTTAKYSGGSQEFSRTVQLSQVEKDQLRSEAMAMSNSELKSAANKIASDYSATKKDLAQIQRKITGGGGMIAGDKAQMQQQLSQLRQNAQNLKDRYDIYSSVAKEKGISLASIDQMSGAGVMGQDANQPQQDANAPATDANKAQQS